MTVLDLVRDDLVALVALSLPLVAAAVAAAVAVGWLAARLGLASDPIPVMVARWLAVGLIVWTMGDAMATEMIELTRIHWQQMEAVER